MGSRVEREIKSSGNSKVAKSHFKVHPIFTIERLPLWSHVDEVIGRIHERVEDKVCVGGEVAASKEKTRVEILNILVRQLLGANKVCNGDSLLVHGVKVLNVVVKKVVRAEWWAVIAVVSCIDLVKEGVVRVECPRTNQVVAHRESSRLNACNQWICVKANLDFSS